MDTLDLTAAARHKKKWRIAGLACTMLVLVTLAFNFGILHLVSHERKVSPICAEITRDLRSRIEYLAPEEKLVAYFTEKSWRFGHDRARGVYDVQIPTDKLDHRVDIHVQVIAGFVAEVSVQDFYVSS